MRQIQDCEKLTLASYSSASTPEPTRFHIFPFEREKIDGGKLVWETGDVRSLCGGKDSDDINGNCFVQEFSSEEEASSLEDLVEGKIGEPCQTCFKNFQTSF